MGLLKIKRDYRKFRRLLSCFSTTILKFLGIVVCTYNYRFGGKNGPRGTGVLGSVGDTGCQGLGKIRGAGVCGRHGVPRTAENTGWRGLWKERGAK